MAFEAYTPSCACEYKDMALAKTFELLVSLLPFHPEIIEFANAYTISTADVNAMLAYYVDVSGGDMEATAMHYLETYSDWESWVSADVAAKVKKRL